ncbi:MAG: hypothetical protein E7658_03030 [Ruminococcaceae bacterium]|nr:hypothetical protein [Oscillospiraceae bacterium]
MGFGLLLGSYFLAFAFSLARIYLFMDIIGGLWMLYAFYKLSQYNRYFWNALITDAAFTAASTAGAVLLMTGNFTAGGFADILIDCLKAVFAAGIHIFMFFGIRGIAAGAESTKIAQKANRNLRMTCVYYFLFFAVLLTGSLYPAYVGYVSAVVYLYWLVCFVLNLVLIYTCFGMLYDDDIEKKEKKQSRIPILNKMHEKFDSLEEKKNQYRRESMELAMEEAENVHNRKKKKKKKKK